MMEGRRLIRLLPLRRVCWRIKVMTASGADGHGRGTAGRGTAGCVNQRGAAVSCTLPETGVRWKMDGRACAIVVSIAAIVALSL